MAIFTTEQWLSLVGIIILCLVHLLGYKLKFLNIIPRSKWLSFASGVSLAYIFLYLLPELEAHQDRIIEARSQDNQFIQHPLYLVTLLSLSIYYGLERFIKESGVSDKTAKSPPANPIFTKGIFYFHLSFFALYNLIVGYVMAREPWQVLNLSLFTLAIGFHFLVNDFGFIEHYRQLYIRSGRWFLSITPLIGWIIAYLIDLQERHLGILISFIVGGTILNVLKEELPEERKSNFWAFFSGVIIYGFLLLLLE